ncbi:unnamed protein product [Effrenium voratum]|nr:unnamed protein product [Effrenium voratum]
MSIIISDGRFNKSKVRPWAKTSGPPAWDQKSVHAALARQQLPLLIIVDDFEADKAAGKRSVFDLRAVSYETGPFQTQADAPAQTSRESAAHCQAAVAPATSSPNSARLSARSVSSLGSPCSASPLQPETGVPRLTGLAKWSSSRREGTSSLSAPRRRASGLARPPLENRWLQRVEACHERPASAASSTRGSSPGSSRGGRPEAIGLQKRRPPSSHREARGEFDTCDKLEEEVLSIMSVLQRPRDSTWAAAKTGVDSNGTALRTRSPAATTPRRSSPSPRDPHLRTAERAVARVEGPGPSLSERARQASSSSSASRTVRPKMSQKASQKLGASSSMTELGGGRLLRDSPLSQGRSARMEGLLRLSRAISEAQRALEVQTTEALRHPEETTSEESKALEAFAERLQRQLAEELKPPPGPWKRSRRLGKQKERHRKPGSRC